MPPSPATRPKTNEGWLFVTLFHAGPIPRASSDAWRQVIGIADWINHAVMTYDELAASFRALAIRGVVVQRNGAIGVARPAWRAMTAAYGKRKRLSVFKLWDAAEDILAELPVGKSLVRAPARSVYQRALDTYGVT